jgi:hypothetical protein
VLRFATLASLAATACGAGRDAGAPPRGAPLTLIWQGKSSSGKSQPDTILFAWRRPASGKHTLRLVPGIPNAKEGDPFLHVTGFDLVP